MDGDDAIVLASELPDKGAMTSLNLSSNALGELVLPAGWTKEGRSWDPLYKHSDGKEQKEHPGGEPEGIIIIANAIKNMRAMTNLNLANNSLGMPNGWSGPDGNGEYKDPDGEYHEALPAGSSDGVIAIANAIPDMGALLSLNLASNNLGELVLPMGWERKSKDNDGMAPWFYQHTDGTKQDNRPEKPEGAIAIANALPGMGAILSLDMSDNHLNYDGNRGMDYLGPAVAASTITSLNIANNDLFENRGIEPVASLLEKGALTKLDISSNSIGAEQEGHLQHICVTGGIELAK
jgi:Leucine-rich repeat (LRR) protein